MVFYPSAIPALQTVRVQLGLKIIPLHCHLTADFSVNLHRSSSLRQDEVLFDSWDAIFNGGRVKDNVPIYSFDGKDVLSDDTW